MLLSCRKHDLQSQIFYACVDRLSSNRLPTDRSAGRRKVTLCYWNWQNSCSHECVSKDAMFDNNMDAICCGLGLSNGSTCQNNV